MSLPYDMGNAGDLLKHGVLAEFIKWRRECASPPATLRFLDPFGGKPWDACVPCEVVRRVELLDGTALSDAQPDIRARKYYGSSHIARNAAGGAVSVYASDRDQSRRAALKESRIPLMDGELFPGFNHSDAFSVLDAEIPKDGETIVLLDPFACFVKEYEYLRIFPKISKRMGETAIILFAPVPKRKKWRSQYSKAKRFFLPETRTMSCPPIKCGGLDGEENYAPDVIVAAPNLSGADELWERLNVLAEKLAKALDLCEEGADMLKPEVVKRNA